MNVRIVHRGQPHRTDLYSAVRVMSDGAVLTLLPRNGRADDVAKLPMASVAEVLLDEDPGDSF